MSDTDEIFDPETLYLLRNEAGSDPGLAYHSPFAPGLSSTVMGARFARVPLGEQTLPVNVGPQVRGGELAGVAQGAIADAVAAQYGGQLHLPDRQLGDIMRAIVDAAAARGIDLAPAIQDAVIGLGGGELGFSGRTSATGPSLGADGGASEYSPSLPERSGLVGYDGFHSAGRAGGRAPSGYEAWTMRGPSPGRRGYSYDPPDRSDNPHVDESSSPAPDPRQTTPTPGAGGSDAGAPSSDASASTGQGRDGAGGDAHEPSVYDSVPISDRVTLTMYDDGYFTLMGDDEFPVFSTDLQPEERETFIMLRDQMWDELGVGGTSPKKEPGDPDAGPSGSGALATALLPGWLATTHGFRADGGPDPGANFGPEASAVSPPARVVRLPLSDEGGRGRLGVRQALANAARIRRGVGPGIDPFRRR